MFSVEGIPHVKSSTIDWSEFDYPIGAFLSGDGGWQYGPVIGEEHDSCAEKEMLGERHKKLTKTVLTPMVRSQSI